MKKKVRKLVLSRETLHVLESEGLTGQVAGGESDTCNRSCTCTLNRTCGCTQDRTCSLDRTCLD